jgi:hypothetical protein
MTNRIIRYLSFIIYSEDIFCRRELSIGNIVDETGYVSNFTRGIRDRCRHLNLDTYCVVSRRLRPDRERLTGCDAILIFNLGNVVKICLFEAKYPRIMQGNYQWDRFQVDPRESHFSDQIRRQSVWIRQCAIWEQFINEYPPGYDIPLFDLWGSTCVWHEMAFHYDTNYRNINRLWTTNDLIDLLDRVPVNPFFHRFCGKNVYEMILKTLLCRKGRRIGIDDNNFVTLDSDSDQQIKIPLPTEKEGIIEEFCDKYGILSYLYIDLGKEFSIASFPKSLLN